MTRDEVLRLAREAGFQTGWMDDASGQPSWLLVIPAGTGCIVELERFAGLVAAVEREACAKIADHYAKALDNGGNEYTRSRECRQAAATIRAREGKP